MTPGLESQLWSGTFVLPFVQFHAVYMSYLFSPCTQMKRRQRHVVAAVVQFNSSIEGVGAYIAGAWTLRASAPRPPPS